MKKENVLEIKDLSVDFMTVRGIVYAVDDVSFDIYKGEIFGIIGESGSGKSTIGRCVLKLIGVDSGEIYFDGKNITHVSHKEQQELRSRMQMDDESVKQAAFEKAKRLGFKGV